VEVVIAADEGLDVRAPPSVQCVPGTLDQGQQAANRSLDPHCRLLYRSDAGTGMGEQHDWRDRVPLLFVLSQRDSAATGSLTCSLDDRPFPSLIGKRAPYDLPFLPICWTIHSSTRMSTRTLAGRVAGRAGSGFRYLRAGDCG
jgi:hypothetical protein